MAFIEYGGKRHVVPAGEMLVGTGADCHLRLAGPGIALRHAVLTTAPDQSVSIRKLPDGGEVEINGVMLGNLPQPPRDWRPYYAIGFGLLLAGVFVLALKK